MDVAARIRQTWSRSQHRNAAYLIANNVVGAAAGLVFLFLVARVAGLPPGQVGLGLAIIAMGTTVAVLAKGGMDTALVRLVPQAGRGAGLRLLSLACGAAAAGALLATGAAWLATGRSDALAGLGAGWLLVGAIAVALSCSWLQDAHFLGEGDSIHSLRRNAVLAGARILLPLPIVWLGAPYPVAATFALALALSVIFGMVLLARLPPRAGTAVPAQRFVASSLRNVSGGAAEFLPGLLLAPIVLAVQGPAAVAYFGMAWTAASLVFLASSAVSRSALHQLSTPGVGARIVVRRAWAMHVAVVLPAAAFLALAAPAFLRAFGPAYAAAGTWPLAVLAASVVVVAPANLYLAVLRSRERTLPLLLFPAAMVAALLICAPPFAARFGLLGVALAWVAANAPLAAWATWRLVAETREVTPDAAPVHRPADAQ